MKFAFSPPSSSAAAPIYYNKLHNHPIHLPYTVTWLYIAEYRKKRLQCPHIQPLPPESLREIQPTERKKIGVKATLTSTDA